MFHGVLYSIIQAVQEFMAFFRETFADATITIKMHSLKDHATKWVNTNHVGFGLLGEQGAASIHFTKPGICTHKRQCRVAIHCQRTFAKY